MGLKKKLLAVAKVAAGAIPGVGGIVSNAFDLLETKGMTPETKAELVRLREDNKQELEKMESDERSRIGEASANVIIAEATSQSWLPRNVRPLFLLSATLIIFFNFSIPIWSQVFGTTIQPIELPDWLYKLFAIGFTGYVGARTFEKWKT